MPKFVRSNSVAVTWSRESCQIAVLHVRGNQCAVRGFWTKELTKETRTSNLIAQGIKALGVDDASYIAAGGDTRGWGFADLSLPAMGEEETRSALGFELRKHTPLPADKLNWGYRALPKGGKGGDARRNLRLFYIRRDAWNQWVGNLGTIGHVDCIIPAPVALNPLFLDQAVLLPDFEDRTLYRYAVKRDGTTVDPLPWNDRLTIAEAFPGMDISAGELGGQPLEVQQRFIPAILLGLYACTQEFTPGLKTLIPVPQSLAIKRNIASKAIALLLCVYILGGIGLATLRRLQRTAGRISRTELEIARIQDQLQAIQEQNRQSHSEFAEDLKAELVENAPNIPPLPEVLLSLTGVIEPPAWISQKLEWNAGLVTFTLNSPQNDPDLITRMEDQPILGDVRQLSSSFVKDSYVRRIQLNARYDTPLEKENLAWKAGEEAARLERQGKKPPKEPGRREPPEDSESQDAPEAPDAQESPDAQEAPGGKPGKTAGGAAPSAGSGNPPRSGGPAAERSGGRSDAD